MVSLSLLAALVLHPTFVSCGVECDTDDPGSFEPR